MRLLLYVQFGRFGAISIIVVILTPYEVWDTTTEYYFRLIVVIRLHRAVHHTYGIIHATTVRHDIL